MYSCKDKRGKLCIAINNPLAFEKATKVTKSQNFVGERMAMTSDAAKAMLSQDTAFDLGDLTAMGGDRVSLVKFDGFSAWN